MDLEKERFAAKLRQLARAAGLDSDEDAARKIDVSYRQYQRWLAGGSEPRASSLKQIATAYGVPVGELVDMPDQDQLNRIETKLDRLLALSGKPATPSSEPERVLGDALALLQAEVESRRRTTADRPTSQPEAQRRTSA